MPKLIKSAKSIEEQTQSLILSYDDRFTYVPSAFKRDKDLAYTVIYNIAKTLCGNPKDIVKIVRDIPEIWQPALSVVQARQNKDKDQAKRMLVQIRKGLMDVVKTLKRHCEKSHFAKLQQTGGVEQKDESDESDE